MTERSGLSRGSQEGCGEQLLMCDAHHHVFPDVARPPSDSRYLLAELLADIGDLNVTKTVVVETAMMNAGKDAGAPVRETDLVEAIGRECEEKQGARIRVAAGFVGYVDLTVGEAVAPLIEAHLAASDRLRGVRHIATWDESSDIFSAAPRHLLLDSRFREGFACLGTYGLSFEPTHMPVLIAGVEALVDPGNWLEAYTCSMASWAPLVMINGPIRKDLALTSGPALMSPYQLGNGAIGHGIGLLVMNMGGIKPGREDMAILGHEGRAGMCIAEDEEGSPWEPMHVFYGLDKDDSAVTMMWPNSRSYTMLPEDPAGALKGICDMIPAFGFDPGCAIIMSPDLATLLNDEGFSRKKVIDYLVEYARVPVGGITLRWMTGNHHEPKNVPLPQEGSRTVRKFWSNQHLAIIVAGGRAVIAGFYGGGGDHGGPITKKIILPKNWNQLVAEYSDYETEI